MAAAMAPPHKRRKLSSSDCQDILQLDSNSTAVSDPSHSHVVASIHPPSSLAPPRTDEHHQSPDFAPAGGIEHFKVILPRQASVPSPTLTSMPSPTLTSWANLPPSPTLTSIPITSASIPAATIAAGVTLSDSTSSSSSPSSSENSTSTHISYGSNSTSLIHSSASQSPTITSSSSPTTNSTTSSVTTETSHISSTSLRTNGTITTTSTDAALVFLATLSDGHTTTIPRHTSAYTTTLRDGELFTVPAISATRSPDGTSRALTSATTTSSNTAAASVSVGGSQGAEAPATSTTTADTSQNNNSSTPPAGTIAGGVVGGAAGLAVILLIAMLFVRWYRRKGNGQHRALPLGAGELPEDDAPTVSPGPGMAERAGLMPLMSAVPGLFRHHNPSVAESSEPSERGFTRVSGRKLPSAFSAGMSSEAIASQQQQANMPMAAPGTGLQRNLSNSSTSYPERDSYGYAGTVSPAPTSPISPTSHSSSVPIRNSVHEMMTMSRGPQRDYPQVHQGGPYIAAPRADILAASPPPATTSFARSDTTSTLRNSRFTEDM